MKPYLVFSTVPSKKVGERIARLLVCNRLAACVNVLDGASSYFWWKGKVDRAEESLLVIKTSRKRFDRLSSFLRKVHPYEVPEIVGFSIEKGSPPYLQWMEQTLGRKLHSRR